MVGRSVRRDYTDDSTTDDLVKKAYRCQRQAEEQTQDWRREFADLYELFAGRQWDQYDRGRRERANKPVVEFNLAQKFMDAVVGLQINNRQEIRYIPRINGNMGVSELLTGAAEWARDSCDAVTEETEAFLDCITGGLGAIETFVDFDVNPEGDIGVARRDPLEMYWDPNARKRNLLDARWITRIRRMTREELEERWPEKADEILSRSFATDLLGESEFSPQIHDATEAWRYEQHDSGQRNQFSPAIVLEYQWFKIDKMYRVKTPYSQKLLTPKAWSKMEPMLQANKMLYRSENIRTKRYHRAFIASGITLESGESPYQDGYTYQFVTGRRDRNQNTWHGIGRHIRDPQRWVNAFFSEIMYIIQTNAKGGLMAEEDAFADPQKAEAEWAEADSIVWTEPGAVQQGKIIPKPVSQYPQGLDKLMEFAVNAMPGTSGLNLEFMGMADRMQPGIVEANRKQSAVAILGWAFDSMRRYYLTHGRCLAYYIREYISDGRLIRISGPEGQQYVPLVRDKLTMEYDVIVDEAPNSPNQRERTWAVIEQMIPMVTQMGLKPPLEILDYLPLPSGVIQAWKKMLQTPQQPDPQAEADVAKTKADTQHTLEKTKIDKMSLALEADKNEIEKKKLLGEAMKVQHEVIKTVSEGRVKEADAFAKRAKGEKDLVDAEAQRLENAAIRKGIIGFGEAGPRR